jgi:hypothetical protein
MNISVIANIFWCVDLYNQWVVRGLAVLFVAVSSANVTVTHYTLNQQRKKVGMFDIDCLPEERKWGTQEVARCKMVEGKGLLGR